MGSSQDTQINGVQVDATVVEEPMQFVSRLSLSLGNQPKVTDPEVTIGNGEDSGHEFQLNPVVGTPSMAALERLFICKTGILRGCPGRTRWGGPALTQVERTRPRITGNIQKGGEQLFLPLEVALA